VAEGEREEVEGKSTRLERVEKGNRLNWRKNREPVFEVALSGQDGKPQEVSEQEVQEGAEEAEYMVFDSELR